MALDSTTLGELVVQLVLALAGILLYIVSPPTTTDPRERYRHIVLGLIAFALLFLGSQGAPLTPATAFAYVSAGYAPNALADLYITATKAT